MSRSADSYARPPGYLEIVPVEDVVQTDWSVEEPMAFVKTGDQWTR